MAGFWLRLVARLVLGLMGAVLLAGAVAALPAPEHGRGLSGFVAAWGTHLGAILQLDFGTSQVSGRPAGAEVLRRLPATLELFGLGALAALIAGVPLGLLLGAHRRLRAVAPLVQVAAAAPVFCAGLLLLWLADHELGWQEGRRVGVLLASQPLQSGRHFHALLLPALTVGAAGAAAVQLALRRAAAAASEAPWRQQLRLLGLGAAETDLVYLLPPVFAGLFAALGEIALALFAATAVAEWVFGWPGAAVLFVKSLALADWGVAALVLLVFATVKLLADFCGQAAAQLLAPGERPV